VKSNPASTFGHSLFAALLALAALPVSGAELAPCLECHGENGERRTPDTPALGGQSEFYLLTQLALFRQGRRDNAEMVRVAKAMSDDELRAYAAAAAKLPPPEPPASAPDRDRFARGEALARQHRCVICHGANLAGTDQVPRLANQREAYLLKALRGFKSSRRIGYGQAGVLMIEILTPLSDDDLVDLAHYLSHIR